MDDCSSINCNQRLERSQSVSNKQTSIIGRVFDFKPCEHCKENIECDYYEEHLKSCIEPEKPSLPAVLETDQIESTSTDVNEQSQDETDQTVSDNKSTESETDRSNDSYVYIQTPEIVKSENELDDAEVESTLLNSDDNINDVFTTPNVLSPIIFPKNMNEPCPVCNIPIVESEFQEHTEHCSGYLVSESTKHCIICSRQIKISEFVKHANVCGIEQSTTCFSCQREIDLDDNLCRKILCPSGHVYCLSCLQNSMKTYVQNESIPLCHPTLCDYQLSRYDILFIPLERRIADQVLTLVEIQRQPQCPQCQSYIDVEDDDEFYDHIDMCATTV